jgi:MFS family permease
MSTPLVAPATATPRSGTAGAALRHRDFRTMWLGSFGSNIGTWMQTLVLPAYIAARTDSALWVGLFVFAQLGPLLLLSIPGGVLADKFPRKPWMIVMQSEQLALTLVMAAFVASDSALGWLFLTQLGIGIGNALNAPAFQGTMPNLVPKEDLPGAISLNSVMINGSRVIGPTIAAVLMSRGVGAPAILVINAVTYLFVIYAITRIRIPHIGAATDAKGWGNFMAGLRIARERTVLIRLIVGMALFSILCLPFVGLFPQIAKLNYGLPPSGSTYKWLYATWGLGACLGGLAIGTVFVAWDQRRLIQIGFVAFAVTLAGFAVAREPVGAFTVGVFLGFAYFATTTAMSTIFQSRATDSERGRLMALWFIAFGGTITIGNLIFGPLIDAVGARWVLLIGAVWALFLAWWCDLVKLDHLHGLQGGDPALEPDHATALDEEGISAGD